MAASGSPQAIAQEAPSDLRLGLSFSFFPLWVNSGHAALDALFWFARENAAADHDRDHRGNKNRKLQVLHRGVLRRLTPPLTHYTSARASRLAPHQFWQLSDIRRNPPRFIFCE
jgi:hypothetical protein